MRARIFVGTGVAWIIWIWRGSFAAWIVVSVCLLLGPFLVFWQIDGGVSAPDTWLGRHGLSITLIGSLGVGASAHFIRHGGIWHGDV